MTDALIAINSFYYVRPHLVNNPKSPEVVEGGNKGFREKGESCEGGRTQRFRKIVIQCFQKTFNFLKNVVIKSLITLFITESRHQFQ